MGNDSSGRWDIPIIIVIALAAGTAFGRFVIPYLFRDHAVVAIYGTKSEGCHGEFGITSVRFGLPQGTGLGSYHYACNERPHESYNLDLVCKCDK